MSWMYLGLAIISEVTGTTCMKLSGGFTRILPSIAMFIFYTISLSSATIAMKKIDVSIAYAVWSGMGTALIASIGFLWFKESATAVKIISVGLVILGVIGLNLSGSTR